MEVKLYTSLVCPFAQRARLALREKGVDYQSVEIDLRGMPDWYLEISPNRKVPLLEVDGERVWESAIIAQYVDEAFPGRSLLGESPLQRARARIAIDRADQELIPRFYQVLRGQQEPDQLRRTLARLEEHPWGPYWAGDQVGLVDLCLYPWFDRSCVLEHYRGVSLASAEYPNLHRWCQAMAARPSVTVDRPEDAYFIEQYLEYAENRR